MALVVVDGEPASMKALELCCVPGVVVKQQEKEQLIVVHAWKDHVEHFNADGSLATGNAQTGNENNTNGAGNNNNANTNNNHASGNPTASRGTGIPPASVGSAGLGDKNAKNDGTNNNGPSSSSSAVNPLTVMQNAMVVASTVNFVLGNRYAQSGLNYKIETLRLQQIVHTSALDHGGGGAVSNSALGGVGSPSTRATPGPMGALPAKNNNNSKQNNNNTTTPSNSPSKTGAAAAKDNASTPPIPSSSNTNNVLFDNSLVDGATAPLTDQEASQQHLAAEVSSYAYTRARHHRRNLILFGVGNKLNEKKQHIIGSSANAMLDYIYAFNKVAIERQKELIARGYTLRGQKGQKGGGGEEAANNKMNSLVAASLLNPSTSIIKPNSTTNTAANQHFSYGEGIAISKAVARLEKPRLNVMAVKSTGTTIRPTSTIKYLVLLQLEFDFDHSTSFSEVNNEGTTVVHAPKPIAARLTQSSLDALSVLNQYVRKKPQPTEAELLEQEENNNANASSAATAAQQQPFDDIGFLFVANDGIPMHIPPPPENGENNNTNNNGASPTPQPPKRPKNYVPPTLVTVSDYTTVELLDDLIRPIALDILQWSIENNMEKRSPTTAQANDEKGDEGGGGSASGAESGAEGAATTNTTNTAAAQIPLLPFMTKAYLELTRDAPHYPLTGENAPQQVAKAVNGLKADILIVPSTTPRVVVESILTLPKPHVLICSE